MDEKEQKTPQDQPKEEIKYATPMQRLWAWVGVVYMVALVLLTTYALSHGRYLQGIGSLMVSPALAGLGGSAILRYRQGMGKGGLAAQSLPLAVGPLVMDVEKHQVTVRGRNVELTKYGQLFLPYVQKTLETLETGIATLGRAMP